MALYGFLELADIAGERIAANNVEVVDTAIQASVDEHNRQMDALIGLFVERTTQYKTRFTQTTAHRLQPLDDNGRARPVKVLGAYDVAFPIQSAGSAWGANYVARAKMTVGEAERITASMIEADIRWMRDHILGALFAAAPWTFVDDLYGSLAIEPLADGGAETYQVMSGADAMATDTHQLGFANAINDGADNALITIAEELREHPENSGDVVVLADAANALTIQALDTFYEAADGNLRVGSGTTELTGTLGVPVPGTIIGYESVSQAWVARWNALPTNYLIGVMTDGPRPLRMREDPEPELQGFQRVAERPDHPFYESQWLRRAGFGAFNRVGAVVAETSDSSYDVPTGFATPMA